MHVRSFLIALQHVPIFCSALPFCTLLLTVKLITAAELILGVENRESRRVSNFASHDHTVLRVGHLYLLVANLTQFDN